MAASPLVFHIIPHTHWDREWYLSRASFQARLVPVLDDLLDFIAADENYRTFLLDGQTVLVEDYLVARPDLIERVRRQAVAGRLQLGPWYVLADEQIPSGESLMRNLLLGMRDAELLGGRSEAMYSPDAFGHPAVWPTLAREFGLPVGALWRGLDGEPGREGDLYRWRGPDGAEVTIYHLPPDGYEVGAALPADDRLAQAWAPLRESLVRRAATRHVAVLVGADHHAAHPRLPALVARLRELEPGHEVRISRLDEFVQAAAGEARDLPLLSGELRWSYGYTWTLQGVHATRAPQKRRNARLELLLERSAEPLAALAVRVGGRDRRPLLDLARRALVRCHFHDAIGGCASDAVARAVDVRFDEVEGYGREIVRAALFELVGHDADRAREPGARTRSALVIWNRAARRREGVVEAEVTCFRRDVFVGPPSARVPGEGDGYRPFVLATPEGHHLPVQVLDVREGLERRDAARHYPDLDEVDRVRIAFRAPAVGGLELLRLTTEPAVEQGGEQLEGDAWVRERAVGNGLVEVEVTDDGTVTLADRRTGARYAGLLAVERESDDGDTYTFCPRRGERPVRADGPVTPRPLAAGPLVAGLTWDWTLPAGDVSGRFAVVVHADSPVVRVTLELDNRGTDQRLRLRLPSGVPGGEALAGAQFGTVRRSSVVVDPADYPRETPVTTAPAHRFVATADPEPRGRRGLALLAPGFFEYECTPDGDLLVTLLRSVGQLSRGDLATRPGHAGWATPTPLAQCIGRESLQLGIAALGAAELGADDEAPSLRAAELQRLWEDAMLPVRGWWIRDALDVVSAGTGVELEGDGLVLSAVKPAAAGGDAIVLRCYNSTDREVAGAWRLRSPVRVARRTRADERGGEPLQPEGGGRTLRFAAPPRGIVTIVAAG